MAKDGIHVSRDQVLVTLGSQQGLDLVGRVFLDPGDLVIVELPSYMAALQVFRSYRAEMRGVPQDDAGMRADVLEETLARLARDGRRPKLIYVVPDFQNPSGVTMSNDRRLRLLQLARQYRTLVVEDNPYRELSFEGAPPPPLAALDREGRVIYLSTFSKTLCPGLRIAWIAASVEFIGRFVTAKQGMDLCCPALTQAIAAEFCAAGHLSSRVGAIVERYRRKRDTMLTALAREMPPGVTWTHPQGGLFLWVRLPDGMDTERLLPLAVEEGGAYVVGAGFPAGRGGLVCHGLPAKQICQGAGHLGPACPVDHGGGLCQPQGCFHPHNPESQSLQPLRGLARQSGHAARVQHLDGDGRQRLWVHSHEHLRNHLSHLGLVDIDVDRPGFTRQRGGLDICRMQPPGEQSEGDQFADAEVGLRVVHERLQELR